MPCIWSYGQIVPLTGTTPGVQLVTRKSPSRCCTSGASAETMQLSPTPVPWRLKRWRLLGAVPITLGLSEGSGGFLDGRGKDEHRTSNIEHRMFNKKRK